MLHSRGASRARVMKARDWVLERGRRILARKTRNPRRMYRHRTASRPAGAMTRGMMRAEGRVGQVEHASTQGQMARVGESAARSTC